MTRPWRTVHWRAQIRTTLRTLYHAQGGRCVYCERKTTMPPRTELRVPGELYASIEHRKPRALGGNNDRCNLAMACEPCNQAKGDMAPDAWKAFMAANPRWWERSVTSLAPNAERGDSLDAARGVLG